MVTRDERLIPLAGKYLDLADLLAIRNRMIGTGLIGGKSLGMLLARAILCKTDSRWRQKLESRDEKLKYLKTGERYWYSDDWFGSEKRKKPA